MKKLAIKFLAVVAGLIAMGLALLTVAVMAFPATIVTKADYVIELKAADGQPIVGTEVVVWKYQDYSKYGTTDERGQVVFRDLTYQWIKAHWRPWQIAPDEMSVRLSIPDVSELKYRFEVCGNGTPRYHVFDDSYDYFFGGHWLGEFDATRQTKRQISDMGKTHTAIAPPGGGVTLWKSQATVRSGATPQPHVTIELTLQQSGTWTPPPEKK